MELKIISPGENGFLKEIQWNQEEVKAWVAARVQDYKNIAYTEDQVINIYQPVESPVETSRALRREARRMART